MKICTIVGTRPQFIKSVLVSKALKERGIQEVLIHTGQHYDYEMSQIFFDEFQLSPPDWQLDDNHETPLGHISKVLSWLESVFEVEKPDKVLVYGDSVVPSTQIDVYDSEGKYQGKRTIEELFAGVSVLTHDGKEMCVGGGHWVESLDAEGHVVLKPIVYVVRHYVDTTVYYLDFTNAWSLGVTAGHSIYGYLGAAQRYHCKTIDRLVPVSPMELGQRIHSVVTRRKAYHKTDKTLGYPMEAYEFMGYFLGDGSFNSKVGKKNYLLHLAAGVDTEEVVRKMLEPLQRKGCIHRFWRKPKGDIACNGWLVGVCNQYMRGLDGRKRIPEFIYNETTEAVAAFVRGALSADGSITLRNTKKGGRVYPCPAISFWGCDRRLVYGVQRLFYRLGIASSISRVDFRAGYLKADGTGRKPMYRLNVKNHLAYAKSVGFLLARKHERLSCIAEHGNKWRIDGLEVDINKVSKIRATPYQGYVYDIEVQDTHRFFANDVLVHNTNATLCGVLAGRKLGIPVAHIEAGPRQLDMGIPEEQNRFIADHLSTWRFCPTRRSVGNLQLEGLLRGNTFTGDVMLDNWLWFKDMPFEAKANPVLHSINDHDILVTVHRPVNTDNPQRLRAILAALFTLSKDYAILFPMHPRTAKMVDTGCHETEKKLNNCIEAIEPLSYLGTLACVRKAKLVITDSGGLQKEAYFAQVPCITLDVKSPWPETVETKWNRVVKPEDLVEAVRDTKPGWTHDLSIFGDGKASEKIAELLGE